MLPYSHPIGVGSDSLLWPFLVIVTEGESDAMSGYTARSLYRCRFAELISAWRAAWHSESGGETPAELPFGFVQIANWMAPTPDASKSDDHWATVRAAQAAVAKTVPRTFMAVSIDLGAFSGGCCGGLSDCSTWPNLCIHPCWKQEVGRRLALGSRAVGYNEPHVCHTGPNAVSATTIPAATAVGSAVVKIKFAICSGGGIVITNTTDFDLLIPGHGGTPAMWVQAVVDRAQSNGKTVVLAPMNKLSWHSAVPPIAVRSIHPRHHNPR